MAQSMNRQIRTLLRACVDDEHMLDRGERLDPSRRAPLARLARRRVHFVSELQQAGRTLRGVPGARASFFGEVRAARVSAMMFAAGPNAGDVLTACKASQARLESRFATALTGEWSASVRAVLVEIHDEVVKSRDELVALQ